jgi:AcrR family transcriptional regulator
MARAYTMRKRAEAIAATRSRILDAARALFRERLDPELITIEETASRAGVSAMTVARHFRSKAELFSELIKAFEAQGREMMVGLRGAPVSDIRAAVHGVYSEYEEAGDFFLRMQAFEHHRPAMHELLNRARAIHRWWVETAFAPQLKNISGREREEVISALAVTCDLLTWKQLRIDQGLSRRKAESIVRRMVAALTKEA